MTDLLAGSAITFTQVSSTSWLLGNLSGVDGSHGMYTLRLKDAGSPVVDGSNVPVYSTNVLGWTR